MVDGKQQQSESIYLSAKVFINAEADGANSVKKDKIEFLGVAPEGKVCMNPAHVFVARTSNFF